MSKHNGAIGTVSAGEDGCPLSMSKGSSRRGLFFFSVSRSRISPEPRPWLSILVRTPDRKSYISSGIFWWVFISYQERCNYIEQTTRGRPGWVYCLDEFSDLLLLIYEQNKNTLYVTSALHLWQLNIASILLFVGPSIVFMSLTIICWKLAITLKG